MTTLIGAFHFGRGTTRGAARALRSAAANSLRSQPEKNIRAGNLDSDWYGMNLMLVRGRTALLLLPIAAGALIGADPAKLAPDQMAKAARTDTITIPTPGELFAALQKPGKPNWTGAYRAPIPTTYKNRAQLALNLGGLIADGFIAVEAQDSQQVKNIG